MKKQCGSCACASEFGYASTPSGPTDGVHCTSRAQAELLDGNQGGSPNVDEFEAYGFLDLWRLECVAEEDYECPNWVSAAGKIQEVNVG